MRLKMIHAIIISDWSASDCCSNTRSITDWLQFCCISGLTKEILHKMDFGWKERLTARRILVLLYLWIVLRTSFDSIFNKIFLWLVISAKCRSMQRLYASDVLWLIFQAFFLILCNVSSRRSLARIYFRKRPLFRVLE